MRLAAMQPTYLPWLGYFDLMDQVDAFVLLDDAQFCKRSWHQRNRIVGPDGLQWLTVPVSARRGQPICDVALADGLFWQRHLRALEWNYAKAPHATAAIAELRTVLEQGAPWTGLSQLTMSLIEWLRGKLGIETRVVAASSLEVEGQRGERLARLCERLGADEYVSPGGSADYLAEDASAFDTRGVRVVFQHFDHPSYAQPHESFTPFASAVDLLCNEGPRARDILLQGRRTPTLEVAA